MFWYNLNGTGTPTKIAQKSSSHIFLMHIFRKNYANSLMCFLKAIKFQIFLDSLLQPLQGFVYC